MDITMKILPNALQGVLGDALCSSGALCLSVNDGEVDEGAISNLGQSNSVLRRPITDFQGR